MSRYFIFREAVKEEPGSGFVEQEFDAESDGEALSMARRHLSGSGHTVWGHQGVSSAGHIKFRFVDYIDGPPKPKEKQRGNGAASGGAGQHAPAG